jgi:hypothetical protein
MGGLFRLEVQRLNQKSLLILGLITNILAQRTDGFGEAGGGCSQLRTNLGASGPVIPQKSSEIAPVDGADT